MKKILSAAIIAITFTMALSINSCSKDNVIYERLVGTWVASTQTITFYSNGDCTVTVSNDVINYTWNYNIADNTLYLYASRQMTAYKVSWSSDVAMTLVSGNQSITCFKQ